MWKYYLGNTVKEMLVWKYCLGNAAQEVLAWKITLMKYSPRSETDKVSSAHDSWETPRRHDLVHRLYHVLPVFLCTGSSRHGKNHPCRGIHAAPQALRVHAGSTGVACPCGFHMRCVSMRVPQVLRVQAGSTAGACPCEFHRYCVSRRVPLALRVHVGSTGVACPCGESG